MTAVRLWFRRNGHVDGLWWTAEIDGVEHHASAITGMAAISTLAMPGPTPETPLAERRHVVALECERVDWRGTTLLLNPSSEPEGNEPRAT